MPKLVPVGRDRGVSRAPVPLEAQGWGTHYLAFSLPSLATGPFVHLHSQNGSVSLGCHADFFCVMPPPPHSARAPTVPLGPTWVIRDHLPTSRFLA